MGETEHTCRAVRVAYLPDPVKLDSEPGYPPPSVRALLASEPDITCKTITVASLLSGCLTRGDFTVLCIPGGFAPNYAQRLGPKGFEIIRAFVRGGGGFVGLCAGAYLGSSECLSLLPVRVLDVHRWARGCGPCQLTFTRLAASCVGALGPSSLLTVRYANGPILQIVSDESGVEHEQTSSPSASRRTAFPLAHFTTEFRAPSLGGADNFPPIMAGSPAAGTKRAPPCTHAVLWILLSSPCACPATAPSLTNPQNHAPHRITQPNSSPSPIDSRQPMPAHLAVVGTFGAGLVILASPHFEARPTPILAARAKCAQFLASVGMLPLVVLHRSPSYAPPHARQDGQDERAHTPFRNFFRFCSQDSPYQFWCASRMALGGRVWLYRSWLRAAVSSEVGRWSSASASRTYEPS